jgi:hypothetical protein
MDGESDKEVERPSELDANDGAYSLACRADVGGGCCDAK